MDLTELYNAILIDDQFKTNIIIGNLTPVLVKFLKVTMRAPDADAKDSVQQALLLTFEKIKSDKIKDPSKLYYYLLTACKNIYLRMSKQSNISLDETNPYHAVSPAEQLDILIDLEKQKMLADCLDELNQPYREFINYLFDNPDRNAKSVAKYFHITVNNAWTRKHRIIKILSDCIEKKRNH